MNSIDKNRGFFCALTITLAAAAALTACGDDTDSDESNESGGSSSSGGSSASGGSQSSGGSKSTGGSSAGQTSHEPDGGEPASSAGGNGGAVAVPEDALYALTTQIIGEASQSYVLLTSTLDAGGELDLADAALEVTGRALGTGPEAGGQLFIANDSAPEITRYELSGEGALEKTGTVSFLARGITKFGEYGGQFQYLSATKAYWFDGATAQIVIWNPKTMKITGNIPLTSLAHDTEIMSFSAAPVWKDDKLYTFAAWRKGVQVVSRAAVVVVDTEADEATIVEDERAGYVRDGVLGNDGMLYVATEAFGAAAHFLDITNPEPALLRFDPSTATFDENFQVSLSSLFDERASGTLLVGPGNQPFLRVLDGAAVPEGGLDGPRQLASAPSWGWAKLTTGDEPEVEELTNVALAGGSVLPFHLGDRTFSPIFVEGTYTNFVELGDKGPKAAEGVTVPGLVFSAVKLK